MTVKDQLLTITTQQQRDDFLKKIEVFVWKNNIINFF
jgi:hypothetical protein